MLLLPDLVTQVCTNKMNLGDEVDLEDYVSRPDKISAAEIAAICQEAGMHAVRKNRYGALHRVLSILSLTRCNTSQGAWAADSVRLHIIDIMFIIVLSW